MATSGRDAEGKPLLDDGSFAGMLSRYGFRFEEKGGYNGDYDKLSDMVQQTVFAEPLYYTMAGYAYWLEIPIGGIGYEVRIWGSTVNNDGGALAAWSFDNTFFTTSNHPKAMAFSLRCQK